MTTKSNQNICCICLETNEIEKYKKLKCKHYVHRNCLLKWNNFCPICKRDIMDELTEDEIKIINLQKEVYRLTDVINQLKSPHPEQEQELDQEMDNAAREILQELVIRRFFRL